MQHRASNSAPCHKRAKAKQQHNQEPMTDKRSLGQHTFSPPKECISYESFSSDHVAKRSGRRANTEMHLHPRS
eukprot:scaffold667245_cov46-Prasinocladus_malaysianus.AAC.1